MPFLTDNQPGEFPREKPWKAIQIILLAVYSVGLYAIGLLCLLSPCILFVFLNLPQMEPAREDIIGVWVPAPETVLLMRKEGYHISTHTFEFKEDGTFVMTNIPDCWLNHYLCTLTGLEIDGHSPIEDNKVCRNQYPEVEPCPSQLYAFLTN